MLPLIAAGIGAVAGGLLSAGGNLMQQADAQRQAKQYAQDLKAAQEKEKLQAAQNATMGTFKDPFTGKKTKNNVQQEAGATGGFNTDYVGKVQAPQEGTMGKVGGMIQQGVALAPAAVATVGAIKQGVTDYKAAQAAQPITTKNHGGDNQSAAVNAQRQQYDSDWSDKRLKKMLDEDEELPTHSSPGVGKESMYG